ncbi:MAG: dockerin type I repeat-containing protein [Clostridia bacterium]|nr:dockerin type I repeat-containing protein [Clostridia bacterium]
MIKLISVLLAVIMLAGACLIPAFAEDKTLYASDYAAMRNAAIYIASRIDGVYEFYGIENRTLWEAKSLNPDNVYQSEGYDCISLTAQMLKESYYSAYPDAPVNYFDEFELEVFSSFYDSKTDKYECVIGGGYGGIPVESPEWRGDVKNGENYDFYLAKREYLTLPDAASKTAEEQGLPTEFEYEGVVYTLDNILGYRAFKGYMTTGVKVTLTLSKEGVLYVSSEKDVEIPGNIDAVPVAYEYCKLRETAEFLADYFNGDAGFYRDLYVYHSIEKLYPDASTGNDPYFPTYRLTEEMLKNAFYTTFPNAPVNLFDTTFKTDFASRCDEEAGVYEYLYPGARGATLPTYAFIGFTKSQDGFVFWFAQKQMIFLPNEAMPGEPYPEKVTYEGKEYVWIGGAYAAYGDPIAPAYGFGLKYTQDGVVLLNSETKDTLPTDFETPPKPDGDFNGDGKVNAKDVVSLMKALVSGGASVFIADVTGDGKVNAKDVIALMKMLIA